MNNILLDVLTTTELLQWLLIGTVGGAAAGLMVWFAQLMRDEYLICRDKKRIFKWLMEGDNKEGVHHRTCSSLEIANATNIPEDRVRYICRINKDIGEGSMSDTWAINRIQLK